MHGVARRLRPRQLNLMPVPPSRITYRQEATEIYRVLDEYLPLMTRAHRSLLGYFCPDAKCRVNRGHLLTLRRLLKTYSLPSIFAAIRPAKDRRKVPIRIRLPSRSNLAPAPSVFRPRTWSGGFSLRPEDIFASPVSRI